MTVSSKRSRSASKSGRQSKLPNQPQPIDKDALKEWRSKNVQLAIARDNGKCVVCRFLHGETKPYTQVHHAFSRDRAAGGWREHYTNLMCVCDDHHPPPIIIPGGSKNLGWVEEVLVKANTTPINKKFQHIYRGIITYEEVEEG